MVQVIQAETTPSFSKSLRAFAQFVSWLAHPLFIPAYIAAVLLFGHRINMLMIPYETRVRIMAMVMINTVLFPGLLVFLLCLLIRPIQQLWPI